METIEQYEKRIQRSNCIRLIICSVIAALMVTFALLFRFGSIQSESMLPYLKIGDSVLYLKTADFNKLQLGDIILYEAQDGRLIIHRIVDIQKEHDAETGWYLQYTVKGDNNLNPDITPVTKDNYRGKVIHIVEWKWLASYVYRLTSTNAQTRTKALMHGILAIIAIMLTLYVISVLRDRAIEKHKNLIRSYISEHETLNIDTEKENSNESITEDITYNNEEDTDMNEELNTRKAGCTPEAEGWHCDVQGFKRSIASNIIEQDETRKKKAIILGVCLVLSVIGIVVLIKVFSDKKD